MGFVSTVCGMIENENPNSVKSTHNQSSSQTFCGQYSPELQIWRMALSVDSWVWNICGLGGQWPQLKTQNLSSYKLPSRNERLRHPHQKQCFVLTVTCYISYLPHLWTFKNKSSPCKTQQSSSPNDYVMPLSFERCSQRSQKEHCSVQISNSPALSSGGTFKPWALADNLRKRNATLRTNLLELHTK